MGDRRRRLGHAPLKAGRPGARGCRPPSTLGAHAVPPTHPSPPGPPSADPITCSLLGAQLQSGPCASYASTFRDIAGKYAGTDCAGFEKAKASLASIPQPNDACCALLRQFASNASTRGGGGGCGGLMGRARAAEAGSAGLGRDGAPRWAGLPCALGPQPAGPDARPLHAPTTPTSTRLPPSPKTK